MEGRVGRPMETDMLEQHMPEYDVVSIIVNDPNCVTVQSGSSETQSLEDLQSPEECATLLPAGLDPQEGLPRLTSKTTSNEILPLYARPHSIARFL